MNGLNLFASKLRIYQTDPDSSYLLGMCLFEINVRHFLGPQHIL